MIGPAIASLTDGRTSFRALREVAERYLHHLTNELGESSGLMAPDRKDELYVDHLPSPEKVTIGDWIRMRFPFHTVAGGIAIMMTWTEAAVDRATSTGLEQLTPGIISTPPDLESRLLTAGRAGHAWPFGEFDLAIHGVAGAVRNSEGRAIGALSTDGSSYRFPGDRGR